MDDGMDILPAFIIGAILGAFIVGIFTNDSDNDTNWKGRYQELVCVSKGLELGKLEGINVCLDPATKAVYKIEMPVSPKKTK